MMRTKVDYEQTRGVTPSRFIREGRQSLRAVREGRQPSGNTPLKDRIPDMGYDEMVRICEASGLDFPKHAKNQGLLTMRARNALYHAVRENIPLVEPGV